MRESPKAMEGLASMARHINNRLNTTASSVDHTLESLESLKLQNQVALKERKAYNSILSKHPLIKKHFEKRFTEELEKVRESKILEKETDRIKFYG